MCGRWNQKERSGERIGRKCEKKKIRERKGGMKRFGEEKGRQERGEKKGGVNGEREMEGMRDSFVSHV